MTDKEKPEITSSYDPHESDCIEIDATGLLCPLPVLRLTRVLRESPPGTRVQLLATDAASAIDVPHFCSQNGHSLLRYEEKDGTHHYVVERGTREMKEITEG